MRKLLRLWRDARGATAIEYGMIAALIAVAAVAAFQGLGGEIDNTFIEVKDKVDG